MNYEESLAYLDELNVFGMNFGLARIEKLLYLLGEPQKAYRTIHVTGTNGKGSVTAMLASGRACTSRLIFPPIRSGW